MGPIPSHVTPRAGCSLIYAMVPQKAATITLYQSYMYWLFVFNLEVLTEMRKSLFITIYHSAPKGDPPPPLLLVCHVGQLPFAKHTSSSELLYFVDYGNNSMRILKYENNPSFHYSGLHSSLLLSHPVCPRLKSIFIPSIIAKGLDLAKVYPQVLFIATTDYSVPHWKVQSALIYQVNCVRNSICSSNYKIRKLQKSLFPWNNGLCH